MGNINFIAFEDIHYNYVGVNLEHVTDFQFNTYFKNNTDKERVQHFSVFFAMDYKSQDFGDDENEMEVVEREVTEETYYKIIGKVKQLVE